MVTQDDMHAATALQHRQAAAEPKRKLAELTRNRANPKLTAVGFEPTPLRTGAWSQRLRPLGQTVLIKKALLNEIMRRNCEALASKRKLIVGRLGTF